MEDISLIGFLPVGRSKALNLLVTKGSRDIIFLETYLFDEGKDRCLETGFLYGLDLDDQISPRHYILVEPHYVFPLADTEKSYLGKPVRRNNTLVLSLGYDYEL
ncbi:MAG: hypothetical protein ABI045_05715 [Flavobacteriales bacterium]